jgi:hypothetical protein
LSSLLTHRSRYARRQRQSGSDRLEKQPTDPASAGRNQRDLGDGTLAHLGESNVVLAKKFLRNGSAVLSDLHDDLFVQPDIHRG